MKKVNKDLIYRFFRCETTPKEDQLIHDWIHASSANREKFDQYDFTYNAMLMHNPEKALYRSSRLGVFRWRRAAIQAAAVLALAVGVNYLFFSPRANERMYSVEVPAGERIKITLEDSTIVWLNGGSRITHPALFAKDARRVSVEGEAYFDVKHDSDRPFIVETFACDVRVLGTTFNVEANEPNNTFSAALLSGSIKATNLIGGNDREIIMQPNELLTYDNGSFSVQKIDNPAVYCWQDGLINIDGLRFDEMMRRFEKIFAVKIVIDRHTMPDVEFSGGKFRKSYGIENVLRTLQLGCRFTYEFDKENNVITIK